MSGDDVNTTFDRDTGLLLAAVQHFLGNDVVPSLEGYDRYQARVAANSLEIVERALRLTPELEQLDELNLPKFGVSPSEGMAGLTKKIASKEIVQSAELMEYFKQRTLIQLAINSPKYWGYAQAKKQWLANDGS